jgi:hypothetical protein
MRRRVDTPEGKVRRNHVDSHDEGEEHIGHVDSHFSDIPAEAPAATDGKRFSRRQRATKSKRSRRH